eukprot:2419441-Pleurochrysis_carterae.AAC.5
MALDTTFPRQISSPTSHDVDMRVWHLAKHAARACLRRLRLGRCSSLASTCARRSGKRRGDAQGTALAHEHAAPSASKQTHTRTSMCADGHALSQRGLGECACTLADIPPP